jgi:pyrrolysyl-tRNA synthetase-like protein
LSITWTETQLQRLNELDASESELEQTFQNESSRERAYQQLEKKRVARLRHRLDEFRALHLRPALCRLEGKLVELLVGKGFAQVSTPIMMSKGLLKKMSIDASHPLSSQIYWLDNNKCLRPMLAPHLYFVLVDLIRLWDKPIRIFEVGPCFRKESHGSQHSSEFTMLNLVEMGLPAESRGERIREMGALITQAAGVSHYRFETVASEIYGDTIDIEAGEDHLEVGSAAMGPHALDRLWKINENWIGIGFGLERLLMAAENTRNLAKFGRSLAYLDGIRLNL